MTFTDIGLTLLTSKRAFADGISGLSHFMKIFKLSLYSHLRNRHFGNHCFATKLTLFLWRTFDGILIMRFLRKCFRKNYG